MEIKVCTTGEWSEKEWSSYIESFTSVFQSDLTENHFRNSYLNTVDGHAYHALLLNDELNVVGSCTVIPLNYKKGVLDIKIGQAVGVFIMHEYRTDPLMLRKMYTKLKEILIKNGIIAVLAIPNATSYSYWKNIVKWRDIGDLPYWVIPVRIGNIIKKWKFLNILSTFLISLWITFNYLFSLMYNSKQRDAKYELMKNEIFYKYRFSDKYKKVSIKNINFTYIIYNESDIKTAYLLETLENGRLSFKSLVKAVGYIKKHTDADIILYVGTLNLFQTVFIKLPKKYEPKRLPLTCDILLKDTAVSYSDMYEFSNWNFGLINYDVR